MNTIQKMKIALVAMFLLVPSLLLAEKETHDGFFLRFQLGQGNSQLVVEGESLKNKSFFTTGLSGVQIGGAVDPNWMIHVGTESLVELDAKDVASDGRGDLVKWEYSIVTTTLGFSYYFLPDNIYIAPVLRLNHRATIEFKNLPIRELELLVEPLATMGMGLDWDCR